MGEEDEQEPEEVEAPPVPEEKPEERELSTGLSLPLTVKDVESVWALAGDKGAQATLLSDLLWKGEFSSSNFQQEVVRDFHLAHLERSRTLGAHAPRKAAVFHAIMDRTLSSMARKSLTTSCVGEPYTSSECFMEYQRLMLQHSVEDPPRSLGVFLGSEARQLTDFAANSIFRHYALYQYCLVCPREIITQYVDMELELPRAPPDLNIAGKDDRRVKAAPKARQTKTRSKGTAERASWVLNRIELNGSTLHKTDPATANSFATSASPVKLIKFEAGEISTHHRVGLTADRKDDEHFKNGAYIGLFPKGVLHIDGQDKGSYSVGTSFEMVHMGSIIILYKDNQECHTWTDDLWNGADIYARLYLYETGASLVNVSLTQAVVVDGDERIDAEVMRAVRNTVEEADHAVETLVAQQDGSLEERREAAKAAAGDGKKK